MAFLRRGHVPHHYDGPPIVSFTLIDGQCQPINVARIHCFEEHIFPRCMRSYVTIFTHGENFTVAQTFEEVEAVFRGKAVPA